MPLLFVYCSTVTHNPNKKTAKCSGGIPKLLAVFYVSSVIRVLSLQRIPVLLQRLDAAGY